MLIVLVFSELFDVIIALSILMLIDFITGITVGLKTGNFNSHSLSGTAYKILAYMSSLAVTRIIEMELLSNVHFFSSGVISILIATEAISIFENSIILGLPIKLESLKIIHLLKKPEKSDRRINFQKPKRYK